jgi:hypothetical protein
MPHISALLLKIKLVVESFQLDLTSAAEPVTATPASGSVAVTRALLQRETFIDSPPLSLFVGT